MDRAIVAVCYDSRQRRILDVTLPSWRRYAARQKLPLIIVEQSYAGEDFYWNKHVLFRVPELRSANCLLFLDNDIFVNSEAGPLLADWDSPLLGATPESTQAGWSRESIARYYADYAVHQSRPVESLEVINTGVLVIPREQAEFLENVYRRWRETKNARARPAAARNDRFALEADQPHVSYTLQAEKRYRDFGATFNTLWWHWFHTHVSPRKAPFLLRAKTAALTLDRMPRPLWRALFRSERATFARCLKESAFVHVAGSKSPLFLGEGHGE